MNILFYLVPKTDVVYVQDEDTALEAMEVMEKYRYSSVPVIGRDGSYVGSLTEGDLLWWLKEQGALDTGTNWQSTKIRTLHRLRDNEPVNINCDMEELLGTAMRQNFIPVVDDTQTFIGIVTRKSIISYCIEQKAKRETT